MAAAAENNGGGVIIDDSLYSRQRYVLGDKAMSKMALSNVLVSGLGGLGVEIAKNIALAGVKSLTLHDVVNTTKHDLATQFFLSEEHIGQNRATASLKTIEELNPYVAVSSATNDLFADLSYLKQFALVIVTELPFSKQLIVNDYCRKNNIAFISADVRGVFGYAFDDFGDSFDVWDPNGEEPQEALIAKITKEKKGIVTCLEHHLHGFETGDIVTFKEVKGMHQLNGTQHKVEVITPTSFYIGDTSSFDEYERDGIAVQQKVPKAFSFLSLAESLKKPEISSKSYPSEQYHVGFQALYQYFDTHNAYPAPWNKEQTEEVLKIAKAINEAASYKTELNDNVILQLAYTSQGSLSPITGFLGGVVAQEGLKAVTGKYTPLKQWLYYDAVEVLPPLSEVNIADHQPTGSRYDAQIICLGKKTQQAIEDARLFMIGCGAIGCEMLKNYAMLGVAAGKGEIIVTDNDLIEKSNLNRQFLFRPNNIGQPKSTTAASAAVKMNPNIHVVANLDRVGSETEAKYSDDFFSRLDVVVNALDNIAARLYVDGRCVTNQRPLLESGTLATKGHVQVIVPYKSESYASQRDPPEKDVPFCTLKSFPNQIEHTIQWARDLVFENILYNNAAEFNKFWSDPEISEKIQKGTTKPGSAVLIAKLLRQRPKGYDDCLRFARMKFEKFYQNSIKQLLHSFPLDHKLNDGTLFWTSPKRPPTPQNFDIENKLHFDFITSFANLWAEVWGIQKVAVTPEEAKKALENLTIKQFQPKTGKKIITDENAKKPEKELTSYEELDKEAQKFLAEFIAKEKPPKLQEIKFEKDDDTNSHVDLITAASNLRATVYSIPVIDRLQTKRIAGRIMPAIATTTAAVSGLVGLELVKLIKKLPNLESYNNAFMNLALPFITFSEPAPVAVQKVGNLNISIWDRWDVKEGDITISQFIAHLQKKYGLVANGIFQDVTMIYVSHFPAHKKRLNDKLSKWLKRSSESITYIDLIVSFEDEEGEDVNGPIVRYYYDAATKQ